MRKNILISRIFAGVILLSFFSCSDSEEFFTGYANLKLKYAGEPLVMFQEYSYPDGTSLYFTRVSFYVDNLLLINEKGDTSLQVDRLYLNPTSHHESLESAERGMEFTPFEASEGGYSYQFGIGVDQVLNTSQPEDFLSNDVLSFSSEYWPGWNSYIFLRVEGFIDLNGDGNLEEGFSLHLGGDPAYTMIHSGSEQIMTTANNQLNIEFDLHSFFGESSQIYDIKTTPQIHTPAHNPQVLELAGNLPRCFN